MKTQKFYLCRRCGNLVGLLHEGGGTLVCCGEPMEELKANTVDASLEKHVPVAVRQGDTLHVTVGAVEHPMTAEHSIQWIYLQTDQGGSRHCLTPGQKPETVFALGGETPKAVYAYCNLHGLWEKEL